MSFGDDLGKFMGGLAAKAQAYEDAFNLYKGDYAGMSKPQLIAEFKRLQEERNKFFHTDEVQKRYEVVRRLLDQMR